MQNKKLSICCITYNHEQFIAQALDSFLMQQCDFDFEIVVGEDCSTDNTRAILLDYKAKYPDKIRLLLHDNNIGMINNFYATLKACKGKYIAICEGDDYWTNPNKLKIQFEFLEKRPEYIFSIHRVIRRREGLFVDFFPEQDSDRDYSFGDLIDSWNIAIGSIVFRAVNLPSESLLLSAKVGDQSLCYGLALNGRFHYMKECMSDYRYHLGGITNNPTIYWEVERIKMFLVLAQTDGVNFKSLIWGKIICLMKPKIVALKQMPFSCKKLLAILGFAKELMIDFDKMPLMLQIKILSKTL